jgi:hypothetical protein
MPHVDLKFNPNVVAGELLFLESEQITHIVAKHFNLQPEQITLELIPQSIWTKNRKDVDLELSLNHDPEGKRLRTSKDLAPELAGYLKNILQNNGINCEISVWVQLYSGGVYLVEGKSEM